MMRGVRGAEKLTNIQKHLNKEVDQKMVSQDSPPCLWSLYVLAAGLKTNQNANKNRTNYFEAGITEEGFPSTRQHSHVLTP